MTEQKDAAGTSSELSTSLSLRLPNVPSVFEVLIYPSYFAGHLAALKVKIDNLLELYNGDLYFVRNVHHDFRRSGDTGTD
jgi:hypothetical protein